MVDSRQTKRDIRHSETRHTFATTPGTRDVLPAEARRLLDVQAAIRERFRLHGFGEVVTPALEYSEVVEEPKLRDAAFKLFDPDNQMLLLRPEMTTPIARLVAQRLRNAPPPHKLSYVLPVYRRASVGRGQSAELYQAGVEVVGSASPQEDAGAISLLVDVLGHLGLRAPGDFAVVLGQTALYEAYLRREAPEAAGEVLRSLRAKDLVGVDALAAGLPDRVAAAVRGIPRLVGPAADGAVLGEAERLVGGVPEAALALDNLRGILGHLEAAGALGAVILDLGLVGRFGYYTGAVFEAYASSLGFTIASGGRYDGLLSRFGRDLPATGFSISLERLLSVLPEGGPAPLLVLFGGSVAGTRIAGALREEGVPVLHHPEALTGERAGAYARSVSASHLGHPLEDGSVGLVPLGGEPVVASVAEVAGRVLGLAAREGVLG
jgi:ATP phosphoribosyltransferase regulatory subunit